VPHVSGSAGVPPAPASASPRPRGEAAPERGEGAGGGAAVGLACLVVILLASALASAADYADPQGRFTMRIPPGWAEAQPREGAAAEWTYGDREPTGRLFVAIQPIALAAGSGGEPLAPLEAHVLAKLQPWLDEGYAIAASAKLGKDALGGQNVDAGMGFRLANQERRAQAFLVLMAAGDTGIVVFGEVPERAANDAGLIRSLPEAMGSFRFLGPGGGALTQPGGLTAPADTRPDGQGPVPPDTTDIVFADDFTDGLAPAWRWDPATGAKQPRKPWTQDSRLAFQAQGAELFSTEKPAPILCLPGIELPADFVAEIAVGEGAVRGDVLSLLVYDSPDRAAVLQVLPNGKGGGAVSATFRRGKRVSGKAEEFTGSRLWLRLSPDGKKVTAAFSTDGSRWTSLQPDKLPTSLPLRSPSLGIAITGPGPESPLSVERVTVSRSQQLATRPPVAWLGSSSDGTLVDIGCEISVPSGEGALREISIEVPAGERTLTVRLERDGDGPLSLVEDAGGAVAAAAVVPGPEGRTVVRIAFAATALSAGIDAVTLSAVTDTGWKTGRWQLGPGGAEAR